MSTHARGGEPHLDDDAVVESAELRAFLVGLHELGADAPAPSAELAALLRDGTPARRRSVVGLLTAAAIIAVLLLFTTIWRTSLPTPAQRMVDQVIDHLTPFHVSVPTHPTPSVLPSGDDGGSAPGAGLSGPTQLPPEIGDGADRRDPGGVADGAGDGAGAATGDGAGEDGSGGRATTGATAPPASDVHDTGEGSRPSGAVSDRSAPTGEHESP